MEKRLKFNPMEDEELSFRPCFEIDANAQLRDVPTTGDEYLLKVVTERKKCPAVVTCDVDISKFRVNQSIFLEEPPALKPAPEVLKLTPQCQKKQVAHFSEVRMQISHLQNNISHYPPIQPTLKCNTENIHIWKHYFNSQIPTLTCIFGLTDSQLEIGLKIMVNHIISQIPAGESIDRNTGRWIYAILACLKLPLLPDTCSLLRNLARVCAEIRSKIDVENKNAELAAAPLNIFICLVTRYFNQWDLAD